MIVNALIVGCGGFIGALLRYVCSELLGVLSSGAFPIATFIINFVGSFLIGVMSVALPALFPANKQPLLFVSTGILGGFTTFSTFSLETFGLIEESRYAMAGLYAISSVVVCVLGVCIGRMIARAVVGQS
ncbi:MAG TPA: fluoride efflux transporter CrcB [Eggerthellaceae bacterium]|nr:fluoride efflux transporter CrcB [Eggerthellaceae bacterium]